MKKENKKVENKFGKDSKILEFLDFLKRAFSKINIKILLLFICICVVVIFIVMFFMKKSQNRVSSEGIDLLIDNYLHTFGNSLTIINKGASFKKCANGRDECDKKKDSYANVIGVHTGEDGTLVNELSLLNFNFFDDETIDDEVKKCFKGVDVSNLFINAFKDEDGVFYYYIDLSGDKTKCNFNEKDGLISNLPVDLIRGLKKEKFDLPKILLNSIDK